MDDGDGNAHLHKVLRHFQTDKTAASQIWSTLSDGVVTDLRAANEHYAQYEGKVQDAAQKVNDTYLKAFSEESGVQSYGEAADLLIQAIDRVISEKTVTFDLAEMIPGSTELTCSAYGDKLVGTLS